MPERASRHAQNVRRVARRCVAGVGLLLGMVGEATVLPAQGTDVDNAVGRARALVENGNGRAGRLVLDSMVQEAGMSTPALGELLYWRGLLAESSIEAERDWRRLLLEVPMSPRAEDALLRLAQLEQLRGRPAASRALLERLVRDYREPSSQARAHFWLAKAWFDENDRPRACGALDVVQRDAPEGAIELRTQADDLRARCRGIAALAPVAAPRVVTATPTPVPPPPPSTTTASPTRPANARYSVQLSALHTMALAEQFVQRLRARNIDARVDGTSAPFRVRTGYFATRAQASARLAELKRQGHDGFVSELTP